MKHRGEIVRQQIAASGLKYGDVAKKLHVSRKTLYNWLEQYNLAWDRIKSIGDIINHDFGKDFAEIDIGNYTVQESAAPYDKLTLEECRKQLEIFRDKCFELYEENRLLRIQMSEEQSGNNSKYAG